MDIQVPDGACASRSSGLGLRTFATPRGRAQSWWRVQQQKSSEICEKHGSEVSEATEMWNIYENINI
jgi:hypothetical protein